jgi:hypothetical protein
MMEEATVSRRSQMTRTSPAVATNVLCGFFPTKLNLETAKVQRTKQSKPSEKLEGRYNLTLSGNGVGQTYNLSKTMYD